jgi:hypothetical protein
MSDTNDLLSEVEDRAANPPRLWDPEKLLDRDDTIRDASVAGIVEELDTRESGFGEYRVSVLRRRDGSRVQVAWFGEVLKNRSKNLVVGDAVALTYLGRVQPRDPNLGEYANFDVIHRKPAAGPRPVAEDVDDAPLPDEPMAADEDEEAS